MLQRGEVATTVAGMTEAQAQALINDICQFIDDFHRHQHGAHSAQIHVEPSAGAGDPAGAGDRAQGGGSHTHKGILCYLALAVSALLGG